MTFTALDMEKLNELMSSSPENKELLTKLLDSHQYTVSKISHEIRNPLALVYSTLQLIESTHPEVLDIRYWHYMREDVEYMNVLLEELSQYNNSDQVSFSEINMCAFMEHLALSFAASLVDTDIEFTSKIDPLLPVINGDKIKLKETFHNLLKNAKDAIAISGTINLHAYAKNNDIIVEITDTGCGIPSEHLASLFTPFVTYKQGGTGLGLTIVQKTIAAHNGNVHVKSVPGAGTTFIVTLPVQ